MELGGEGAQLGNFDGAAVEEDGAGAAELIVPELQLVGLRPQGTHRGEEVDGFEEVALALRVVADEDREAGWEGELEAVEVAVVKELEGADAHGGIIGDRRQEPGGRRGNCRNWKLGGRV